MKKSKRVFVLAASSCLAFTATTGANAESHEQSGPSFWPVEIYACNYVAGKGMADLQRVIGRWNNWMDDNGRNEYWAFTMLPVFHSQDIDFDVAWLGGWRDGATMGDSVSYWINNGGALQTEFDKVLDCGVHANFAVLELKSSPDPWQTGPVEFSDCTVKEGRTVSEALDAAGEWVAYQGEHGVEAGHYILFPAYGEASDAEYDFKWVSDYSYAGFGANYDFFGNGGGWRKYGELFDRLLDCDSARMYHAAPVRQVELEE